MKLRRLVCSPRRTATGLEAVASFILVIGAARGVRGKGSEQPGSNPQGLAPLHGAVMSDQAARAADHITACACKPSFWPA